MVHPHVFFKSTIPLDSWWKLQTLTVTNRVHFYVGCVLRIHEGALLPPAVFQRCAPEPSKLTHEDALGFVFSVSLEL